MPATLAAKPGKKDRENNAGADVWATWPGIRNRAGELMWVFASKFTLIGANAALMLFLGYRLDLEIYGLLVITISAQLLISRLLMMGVDSGLIRLRGLDELRARSHEVAIAGLLVIVGNSSVLVFASLIVTPVLFWFGIPYWIPASITVGAIGTSLVDFGYSFRLARHEYPLSALAQGGTAIFRLGLTLIAVSRPTHILLVFIAYHGASLLSGIFQSIVLIKTGWLWPDRPLVWRLVGYSRWIAKTNIIVIFSLYQGTFLLTVLGQQAATGIFGLALTLSLGFFAIFNAYSQYLLARITTVDGLTGLRRFLRQALAAAVLLSLGCIPLAFVVTLVIPRILRPELSDVIPVFCYLAASMVFLILEAPFDAACHYLMRPYLVSFNWLMRVVFIGVAGVYLVPGMNAVGAALAQLVGSSLAAVVFAMLVMSRLRSAGAAEQHSLEAASIKPSDASVI